MLGVVIFLLMMATAFMGYVLPWGQMSFWGATVITNLFSRLPAGGRDDRHLAVGRLLGRQPDPEPLLRLHYLLPFVIVGVVFLHIAALHITGSNNPLGIEPKGPQDTLPFHPYYTVKDSVGIVVYLAGLRGAGVLRAELPGPPGQLHPGQPAGDAAAHRAGMVLPALLRDPARGAGQARRRAADVRLHRRSCSCCPGWTPPRCARCASARWRRPFFAVLGGRPSSCCSGCGGKPAEEPYVTISRVATAYYFLYFLVILPLLGRAGAAAAAAGEHQSPFRCCAAAGRCRPAP